MRSAATKLLGALLGAAVLVAAGVAQADQAPGGTLDRIRQQQTIRIAYREDAPPFSYKDGAGQAAGLIVDLCRAVAANLSKQLNLSSLNVVYVPVTATDRFAAIQQQRRTYFVKPPVLLFPGENWSTSQSRPMSMAPAS